MSEAYPERDLVVVVEGGFLPLGRSSTPLRHSSRPLVASVDRSNHYHRKTTIIININNSSLLPRGVFSITIATTLLLVVARAPQPTLDLKMSDIIFTAETTTEKTLFNTESYVPQHDHLICNGDAPVEEVVVVHGCGRIS